MSANLCQNQCAASLRKTTFASPADACRAQLNRVGPGVSVGHSPLLDVTNWLGKNGENLHCSAMQYFAFGSNRLTAAARKLTGLFGRQAHHFVLRHLIHGKLIGDFQFRDRFTIPSRHGLIFTQVLSETSSLAQIVQFRSGTKITDPIKIWILDRKCQTSTSRNIVTSHC